jgi:hypothetical protein
MPERSFRISRALYFDAASTCFEDSNLKQIALMIEFPKLM